jgi:hypothetical protein
VTSIFFCHEFSDIPDQIETDGCLPALSSNNGFMEPFSRGANGISGIVSAECRPRIETKTRSDHFA